MFKPFLNLIIDSLGFVWKLEIGAWKFSKLFF